MKEGRFAPVLDNLTEGAMRMAHEREKRMGHLFELSEALLASALEGGGEDSPRSLLAAVSALLPACAASTPQDPTLPAHHAALWRNALSSVEMLDRVCLALAVRRTLEGHIGRVLTLADVGDAVLLPPERERVVYVRNPLADAAYERLSTLLSSPTVGYRQSFRELFDDVENRYADYAVLPLYSDGITIQSVSSLIHDYGLKICGVSAVPTEEGEILFALITRGAVIHRPPSRFMFHILPENGAAPLSLLHAVFALGASLVRLDPIPLTYDNSCFGYRVIAAAEDPDIFVSLSVYLSLYAPGYTGYGFYSRV